MEQRVAPERLKAAPGAAPGHDERARTTVADMLATIEREGEAGAVTARASRVERMEGRTRAGDARLAKYPERERIGPGTGEESA